jgi:hypothetical protein
VRYAVVKPSSSIKSLVSRLRRVTGEYFTNRRDPAEADVDGIGTASKILRVSEFRFFQLAYFQWYGHEISDKDIESVFSRYMMKNEIPPWVRHFTREILSRYSLGILDPREYNNEYTPDPYDFQKPLSFLPVFMTFAYLIFYLILTGSITFP